MNIHEYQAKELLQQFGVAVLPGGVAHTADEAEAVVERLGGPVHVVKAQIHAGGRGKGHFAGDEFGQGRCAGRDVARGRAPGGSGDARRDARDRADRSAGTRR